MRRSYEQLSLEDRCEIARLSANDNSVRQIAAALDRSPSTISRELKRNRGRQIGYRPSYAEQQTRARRWKGSRLERDESLRATVIERLASGWAPQQIAGRPGPQQGRQVVSYESLYRFIYAQLARTKDYRWRRYLPRGKSKRGCRGRKGGGSQNFIEGRISLAERPPDAADRETPGHWEADLMMFSKYGQAILTVHERKSRLLLAIRLASKAARGVARHLVRLFAALPEALRQTVTFDNGTEFACHLALHGLAIETFFCDPSPPGKRAASRMPSAGCAASCRARLTSQPSQPVAFAVSLPLTTTPRANALTSAPPPSPLLNCCTSSVNPPPCFRRDDGQRVNRARSNNPT